MGVDIVGEDFFIMIILGKYVPDTSLNATINNSESSLFGSLDVWLLVKQDVTALQGLSMFARNILMHNLNSI